jgi:DNA-binding transcriptional LysR family regulator
MPGMDHGQMDHSEMSHGQMEHGAHGGHGDHVAQFRTLFAVMLVIAVPEDNPIAKHRKVALSRLKRESFVLPPRHLSPGMYDHMLAACHAEGIIPKVPHQPRHLLSILSLVSMGAGVSILPRSLAAAKFPGVTFVEFSRNVPSIEIAAVWSKTNKSIILAKAIDQLFRQHR